ncbi:Aste57867_15165 [Aphanomyces stellatus]|uniref:Aste57867_15165 protein n=1 Tax=Aphanomyces stellatus TaxID=120398 RepID=A0A485L2I1_9STRA|nr:hypothetical protein As57867_015109 [Aphanomyces stellatus]VFT91974.1 Aste57867_15165 [Aphanomyces stellatus]
MLGRPTSASPTCHHHPASKLTSPTRIAAAARQEPFLDLLLRRQEDKTNGHDEVLRRARVQQVKRQTQDFVDRMPFESSLTASASVPQLRQHPADEDGHRATKIRHIVGHTCDQLQKARPRSSVVPVMKMRVALQRPRTCQSKTPRQHGPPILVKHPMRVVATQLHVSLDMRETAPDVPVLVSTNQTQSDREYYSHLYMQVMHQLGQHQPTAGLAGVMQRIWDGYVDPLHAHVDRAKRLGLEFFTDEHQAEAQPTNAPSHHYANQTESQKHHIKSHRKARHRGRADDSHSSDIDKNSGPQGGPTEEMGGQDTSNEASQYAARLRQRRRSQTALGFHDGDQAAQIRKILCAKVRAPNRGLEGLIGLTWHVPGQRLRESIFSSVKNADAARQKDNEVRMRKKITAQLEHSLVKRYSTPSNNQHSAATQIQRMARGKLAGKRMRFARIVALMQLTKEAFQRKLQRKEWAEFDEVPDTVTIEELDEEMKVIVWEVKRLVRDLSLDWWKQSLGEERARLAWEVSDLKDDLRHLQQQTSVLVQNAAFCMGVMLDPRMSKMQEDRIGVHQYYSPSPRLPETNKELLDMLTTTNTKFEDAIFKFAKAKQQRTAVFTQTDKSLERHPTYIQALEKLVEIQSVTQTDTETETDNNNVDVPPPLPLVQLTNEAINPTETSVSPGKASVVEGKHKRRALHHKHRHDESSGGAAPTAAIAASLKSVPPSMLGLFKLIGKVQAHKPKSMNVAQLKLLLHDIYAARMVEESRPPLAQFLYRFFARRYGLRNVAEIHMVNFLVSLKKYYKHDVEVLLIARACEFKQVDRPLSLDGFDFYMGLLAGMGSHRHEAAVPVWYLPHVFINAIELIHKYQPGGMLDLIKYHPDRTLLDMEMKASQLPPVAVHCDVGLNAKSQSFVSRDDLLAICLTIFEALETAIHDYLIAVFKTADVDQNGELSFIEFNSMVQKVFITPEEKVELMFHDAIMMTGNPIHDAILPEVFVVIAKREGLTRKSYVGERRDAIKTPVEIPFRSSELPVDEPPGKEILDCDAGVAK